jgi:hypothetical protein
MNKIELSYFIECMQRNGHKEVRIHFFAKFAKINKRQHFSYKILRG